MTPSGRVIIITVSFLASLGCLIGALAVYATARRLASEIPVTATVVDVRSERGEAKGRELVYYARLLFDRKQDDGGTFHCDVADVFLGIHSATIGAKIRVAPQTTTCIDPDVICDTCVAPSNGIAFVILMIGLGS